VDLDKLDKLLAELDKLLAALKLEVPHA